MPGVANLSKVTDQRTSTIGEFVQIVLSEDHRPGTAQSPDHLGILAGNSVFVQLACRRRAHSSRVNQILHGHGYPVQGPAPFTACDLCFRHPRLRQSRFRGDRNECIQHGIQLLYPLQALASQFHGRDFPAAQPWCKLRNCRDRRHANARHCKAAHSAACACLGLYRNYLQT